jgi:surface antigen
MRPAKHHAVLSLIALLLASACQTNEQTGGLVGASGGALLGGALGQAFGHSSTGTLLGASLGALGGYFVGTAIGQQLDEPDRKRATEATHKALSQPVYFSTDPAVAPRLPKQSAQWKSDHSGVAGTAKVVAAQKTTDGGECRTVREVAYIKGQEVPQTSRYCRSPEGEWVAQS